MARATRSVLVALASALAVQVSALPSLAEAPPQTAQAEARLGQVAEFLTKWHTRAQLEMMREHLGGVMQLPSGADRTMTERIAAEWRAAVTSSFDVGAMFDELANAVAGGLTGPELDQLVRFTNSALGRKICAAVRPHDVQPDPEAAVAQATTALQRLERNRARKAKLEAILVAMDSVDAAVGQMLNFSLGSAIGASAVIPTGRPRMAPEEFAQMLQANRAQMRVAVKPAVLGQFAMMLEPLSLDELTLYHRELTTGAGRKYTRISRTAFETAMKKQALAVGAAFARNMKAERL